MYRYEAELEKYASDTSRKLDEVSAELEYYRKMFRLSQAKRFGRKSEKSLIDGGQQEKRKRIAKESPFVHRDVNKGDCFTMCLCFDPYEIDALNDKPPANLPLYPDHFASPSSLRNFHRVVRFPGMKNHSATVRLMILLHPIITIASNAIIAMIS